MKNEYHATTVVAVRHKGKTAIGADGQATMGNTIAKSKVKKIRRLLGDKILVGFSGSTADSFALLDLLEGKLNAFSGNLKRASVELAKNWRTDKYLRQLEAMMIVIDKEEMLVVSGTGDVLEPDDDVAAIGSGSMFAKAAALALKRHAKPPSAEFIVRESLKIASEICIYTNDNHTIEVI